MRTREILRNAKREGKRAGINAAGWAFMPGRDRDSIGTARRILAGIEDGDPAILDAFRTPDLSGEFSGDPTPRSLAEDCGLDEDDPRSEWLQDKIANAWEDAASSSFWTSLERACRAELA